MSATHLILSLPTTTAKVLPPRTFLKEVPKRESSHVLSPLAIKQRRLAQMKQEATNESYSAFKEIPSIVMMSYFTGNQVSLMSLLQLLQVLKNSIMGIINSVGFLKKYEELEMDIWPIFLIYFVGYTALSGFVYWKGGKMGLWDWENEWIGLEKIPARVFKDFVV